MTPNFGVIQNAVTRGSACRALIVSGTELDMVHVLVESMLDKETSLVASESLPESVPSDFYAFNRVHWQHQRLLEQPQIRDAAF